MELNAMTACYANASRRCEFSAINQHIMVLESSESVGPLIITYCLSE